jgi:hypothetical protein
MWIFQRRSRTADAPKQGIFLQEELDPKWLDEQREWQKDMAAIDEEAAYRARQEGRDPGDKGDEDIEATPIKVKNLDRLKRIYVHVGELPRTKIGALSRQEFLGWGVRKLNLNLDKRRLDAYPRS